jgi:hypothetical protein
MKRHTALVFSLTIGLAVVLAAAGGVATVAGRPAAPEASQAGAPPS